MNAKEYLENMQLTDYDYEEDDVVDHRYPIKISKLMEQYYEYRKEAEMKEKLQKIIKEN